MPLLFSLLKPIQIENWIKIIEFARMECPQAFIRAVEAIHFTHSTDRACKQGAGFKTPVEPDTHAHILTLRYNTKKLEEWVNFITCVSYLFIPC